MNRVIIWITSLMHLVRRHWTLVMGQTRAPTTWSGVYSSFVQNSCVQNKCSLSLHETLLGYWPFMVVMLTVVSCAIPWAQGLPSLEPSSIFLKSLGWLSGFAPGHSVWIMSDSEKEITCVLSVWLQLVRGTRSSPDSRATALRVLFSITA